MKSRTTTYLLIIGALAIWGAIVWHMLAAKPDLPEPVAPVHAVEKREEKLQLNYRDPFLGVDTQIPVPAPPQSENALPEPPSTTATQHNLLFCGSISRGGMAHALIEINGEMHTLRRGETAAGYRLETLWADSARLKYGSELCVARR